MSKFKGIPNTNGRPKGAVNKTTAETKELLQKIVSNEIDNIPTMLDALKPKDRLDAITKLLPYIIPRQTEIAVETNQNQFQPLTITLLENGNTN